MCVCVNDHPFLASTPTTCFFSGISLARKFPSDRSTSPLRWFILWIMMYHFYIDQLTSHSGPVPDVSSFLYSPLQDPSHTLSNPLISIHTKTYSQTHAHTHTHPHTHISYAQIFIALTESRKILLFSPKHVKYGHFHVQQTFVDFTKACIVIFFKACASFFFIRIPFVRIPRLKIA